MIEPFPLLHDPARHERGDKWYCRIPVFGWMAAYAEQIAAEQALVDQAVSRGPVPDTVWTSYTYSESIRRKIEAIVIANAFPKGSTFHPLDPVELMFVLRYGDLNEVEILISIEEVLGFTVDDALVEQLIHDRTTFIDFIRLVEGAATLPIQKPGAASPCPP